MRSSVLLSRIRLSNNLLNSAHIISLILEAAELKVHAYLFWTFQKIPTLNKNVFAIVIARGCCGVRPDTGVFCNSCFDLKGSSIDDIAIFQVKIRRFQNEFMKSSLLLKYEPKIVRISAL